MRIRNKPIINENPDISTKIGECVRFNGILLKCIKSPYGYCDDCYFYNSVNMSCKAKRVRMFNCSCPSRIFVEV